jgi:hypothetical protein
LLRLKQFLLRSFRRQDRVRGLERGGMGSFSSLSLRCIIDQLFRQRRASTRALIFASRLATGEVSSLKGEKPQSSVVPSCSSGM